MSCLVALAGPRLAAQEAAGAGAAAGAVVVGVVRRADDGARGIAGALVSLDGLPITTKTGPDGRFRVAGVALGPHVLRVRLLGYEPAAVSVDVTADSTIVAPIAMAQALRRVMIAGREVTYPVGFEEQYKRASRGRGNYFTREQIDSLRPADTKSLLAMLPTVSVSERGITFRKCQAGLSGLSAAPGQTALRGTDIVGNVMVYVDGVRMTRSSGAEPDDAEHILRAVLPTTIQLIEVYSGTSGIPGEFLADACAVIAIWTRRY